MKKFLSLLAAAFAAVVLIAAAPDGVASSVIDCTRIENTYGSAATAKTGCGSNKRLYDRQSKMTLIGRI